MFALAFQALGAEANGGVGDLGRVQTELESARRSKDAFESVRNRLDDALEQMDRDYGQLIRSIAAMEKEAVIRDQKVAQLQKKCDELKVSIKRQRRVLEQQLQGAYKIGRQDWLQLLLNQEDPAHLSRVLAYYGYLNRTRSHLVAEWERDIAKAEVAESELQVEARQQKELKAALAADKARLASSREARRELLRGWDLELRNEQEEIARMEEDERKLSAVVSSVESASIQTEQKSSPSVPLKRKFQCPTMSRIDARFGSRRAGGKWDGIVLPGAEGAPVRAVTSGQVAYADWLRGYGLLMIVDHGQGEMSLYAFNQTLYKEVGQEVNTGDVIAAVGSSGGRPKPALYFGIRQQGVAVDPQSWCTRKS
jgi:septal ring factor EnvC (AmiA/AmiB activator)